MQTTFAVGVVSMAQDVVNLLRCLLVNTTYGSNDTSEKSPTLVSGSVDQAIEDQPRRRFWFRRYTDGATFVYLTALSSGTIGGIFYYKGTTSKNVGDAVMKLRFDLLLVSRQIVVIYFHATDM
jgi:hypothetical protein